MHKKIIWFAGIPSSGKSTMALRLHLELEWANKRTILLDDETIKRVEFAKTIDNVIELIGEEYNIIVSPYPQKIPRKPDLIVWCRCPIDKIIGRDKVKIINGDGDFEKYWGSYFIQADLILDTYDRTRQTKENIEFCWQILKRKMEKLFGNFSWRVCSDKESDWASKEPGKQYFKRC